jgi:DNA-binding transcriptional LysR family regulator
VEAALEKAELPCRVALEAGGWEIIKRYVELGLGIAVVPAFCLERGAGLIARSAVHLFGADSYGLLARGSAPPSAAALELRRSLASPSASAAG